MKLLLITCFTTLLFTLAGPASASSDSDSGTIAFSGAITNGSCDVNIVQNPVIFNCYNPANGKNGVTIVDLMNLKSLNSLPIDVKMHWLNPEKDEGIIEVSYL